MEARGRKAKPRVLESRPEQRFVLKQLKWIMDAHFYVFQSTTFLTNISAAHMSENERLSS